MDVYDIVKDAFTYPFNNHKGWLLIGVLYLINTIFTDYLGFGGDAFLFIYSLISIVLSIVLIGMAISIMKATLNKSNEIPGIDFKTNFIDGIKNIIITIIYEAIPFLVTAIIAIPLGFYSKMATVFEMYNNMPDATSLDFLIQSLPDSLRTSVTTDISILLLIFLILFLIAMLFLLIAQVRLAETGSIYESFKIGNLYRKISSIGWGKYIIFYLITALILIILTLIGGILSSVGMVGKLISMFIIVSYMMICTSRGFALIYMEG